MSCKKNKDILRSINDARDHIERIRRELKQENCGSRMITALQNGLEMYVLLFPVRKI